MGRTYRIALGSIIIECNHLGGTPADSTVFAAASFGSGPEVLEQPAASSAVC